MPRERRRESPVTAAPSSDGRKRGATPSSTCIPPSTHSRTVAHASTGWSGRRSISFRSDPGVSIPHGRRVALLHRLSRRGSVPCTAIRPPVAQGAWLLGMADPPDEDSQAKDGRRACRAQYIYRAEPPRHKPKPDWPILWDCEGRGYARKESHAQPISPRTINSALERAREDVGTTVYVTAHVAKHPATSPAVCRGSGTLRSPQAQRMRRSSRKSPALSASFRSPPTTR